VLGECEGYLRNSWRLGDVAVLKAKSRIKKGRVNPLRTTKNSLRVAKDQQSKDHSRTEGIELKEIERRNIAEECLRCAWPSDRKGSH